MAYKTSSIRVTQRDVDNQFLDLKYLAKPGTTVVTVNGSPMTEYADYTMIDAGLYPLRIRTRRDVNRSLNNKYFMINCKFFAIPFFVWYNVSGYGDVTVPFHAANNQPTGTCAQPIEVKLVTGDSALVVAQKTAKAIRALAPEFFNCDIPALFTDYDDARHCHDGDDDYNGRKNDGDKSTLYIYDAQGAYLSGVGNGFEPKTMAGYGPGNTGFDIDNVTKPEKNSRITLAAPNSLMTRKITGTTANGSTTVILDKSFAYSLAQLNGGTIVAGTGIPSGAVIANTFLTTDPVNITKTAFNRQIAITSGSIAGVGHGNFMFGDIPNGFDYIALITSNSVYGLGSVPRKTAPDAPYNAEGTGQAVLLKNAFDLDQAATATGTVTLTLTMSTTPLKVGDVVNVQYEIDDMGRDCVTRTMKNVKHGGPIGTRNDTQAGFLQQSTSTIDIGYRVGGNLSSKNTLVLLNRALFSSYSFYDFLTDSYGIDAKIIMPDFHNSATLNMTNDMGSIPTGPGSATTYSSAHNGPTVVEQNQSLTNTTRALINFIEKLDCGKVFLASARGSSSAAIEVARFRPDLLKGMIVGDAIYLPTPVGSSPASDSAVAEYAAANLGSFSSSDLSSVYATSIANATQHKNLWEGSGTEMSQGDISLMTDKQRWALIDHDATYYNNYALMPFPVDYLSNPIAGGFYNEQFSSAPYSSAYGQALCMLKPATPQGSLNVLKSNQVPTLLLSDGGWIPGIPMNSYGNEVYQYGILQSPSGSLPPHTTGASYQEAGAPPFWNWVPGLVAEFISLNS